MAEALKKCRNPGCNQEYVESGNLDNACRYHDGQVIFHDTRKGWACCNVNSIQRVAYDWDDFQKLEGCKFGRHSDQKQTTDFFKSNTVSNAETALKREEGPKIMTIEEFDKQEAERKAKAVQEPENEIVTNSEGLYVCGNLGCNQAYDPSNNLTDSCLHHTGAPMFHDLKKFWTCCKKEAWDWDDFMKLPKCSIGQHMPKYRKK